MFTHVYLSPVKATRHQASLEARETTETFLSVRLSGGWTGQVCFFKLQPHFAVKSNHNRHEDVMSICRSSLVIAAAAGCIFAAPHAHAHEIKIGALVIHHPWIRQPPPKAAVASAYTTIDNTGKEDDTLLQVTVEGVPTVQIHDMKMQGDVMKMDEMKMGMVIPAGQSIAFKPKGPHIMLIGLKSSLMVDEQVQGTMVFAKAGTVKVDFEVTAPGADVAMKH